MSSKSFYDNTYTSFSGADIVATITPVGGKPVVIGELQTISYSTHREVLPVRTLGRINPKGFTKGPRTIAGSLIFTVFDRHFIRRIINNGMVGTPYDNISSQNRLDFEKNLKMDEMPPFDVTIMFGNEHGRNSVLRIFGINIVDEGQTMSIEDIVTEQTMSYLAEDIYLLKYHQNIFYNHNLKNKFVKSVDILVDEGYYLFV